MIGNEMLSAYLAQARSHTAQAKALRHRIEIRGDHFTCRETIWAMIHAHEAAAQDLLAALEQADGVA